MWYGEYTHTLDDKDRFVLPAKFREKIKDLKLKKFFLTKGLERCLFLFSCDVWEKIEEKLKSLPFTKKESRFFDRFYFGSAQEIEIDRQGRISIPVYLKEFAKIKKNIIIVGIADRIEIWAKEEWDNFCKTNQEKFEEIAENLFT
ncbi:MAG: division/cell wall cluster transcriptional repressor MraZ [Candidatus Omnitrophica bacterium]|nr:division/cell wall cluster transcriptional repressor MraZ [Candidatus Omnitrophota bacterium]MCM8830925.1 division/cell wall cluster transcriptional repressor MraZ [Candidatus Omnitrophota bacterium]